MLFLCQHLAINRPQGYDTFRQRIRRFVAWQIWDQPGDWRCAVGQNPAVVGWDGWEMLKSCNFWSVWIVIWTWCVGFCGSRAKRLHVFAGVLKMPAYQGFGDSNGVWGFQWNSAGILLSRLRELYMSLFDALGISPGRWRNLRRFLQRSLVSNGELRRK